jgi:hypothetical protein
MSTCKDVIVNIGNFNPLNTYTVVAKLVASVVDFPVIPAYTKVATGPTVVFSTLPDGEYEVGITMVCAEGNTTSRTIWQRASTASCIAPQAYVVNAITTVSANMVWTAEAGFTFQQRLDRKGDFAATSAAATHALTGLIAGRVYEAELRKKCGTYAFSEVLLKHFATTVIAPTFRVDVIEKICDGNAYKGYRLRFSITGGMAAPATYQIQYTTLGGTVTTIRSVTTTVTMTIYQLMLLLSDTFEVTGIISGVDYGAFDIISHEPKTLPGVPANCQDIDMISGYSVALI